MKREMAKWMLVVVPALATACVGGSEDGPPPEQTEALKQYVLDAEPADVGTKIGTNFDNKITLLGAKVEPAGALQGGQRVKVTMYWKCVKELGEPGWKLFTHVIDGSGERLLNIDNVGPIRRAVGGDQALPPSAWKAGKIYVDEQEFAIPKKVRTQVIQPTVGIWKGDQRLPIAGGPKDRDNRAIAATLRLAPSALETVTSTRVPELRVNKLEKGQKIVVDGKLDDEAWKTAAATAAFVDVRTGKAAPASPVGGMAKLTWDDTGLYVAFDVKDKSITGGFKKDETDPHLWTKDTVEIMIDPDGDGDNKDYYEIQINPQNLVFDSRFDTYNQPKKEPDGPFGHQDWSAKLKSAVVLDGTLDKADDVDKGYVVEAMIPWKSLDKAKKVPPEPGQTFRMNLYAMENNGGVAWSPILGQGNFHRASRFGKVLFATKDWTPPAPALASGAPAGSGVPRLVGSALPGALPSGMRPVGASAPPPAAGSGIVRKPPSLSPTPAATAK
jgi:hypothetical protein